MGPGRDQPEGATWASCGFTTCRTRRMGLVQCLSGRCKGAHGIRNTTSMVGKEPELVCEVTETSQISSG